MSKTTAKTTTPAEEAFDISALVDQDTAEVVILHPVTEKPLIDANGSPWTWTIAGPSHPVSKKLRNITTGKLMKQMRAEGRTRNRSDDAEYEATGEQTVEDQIEALVARSLNFTPVKYGETVLQFSAENVRNILNQQSVIRSQLNQFLADEAAFLA